MNIAISDWDDEYARLSRAAAQLRSVPHHPSASTSHQQQIQSLHGGLSRLNARLFSMQSSNQITPEIAAHRKLLVDNLIQQISSSPVVMSMAGTPSTNSTNPNNSNLSLAPKSAVQLAIQHQDNLIDDLAKGVSNLKGQTLLIHDEANLHNRLLDNMDDDVEAARIGLENETARAKKLSEQGRYELCKLYIYIAVLSFLLFLLILTGLS